MTFNEQNTIEEYVISKLSSKWKYIPPDQLGRDERDVLIEGLLKKSLMRINPEIKMMPERADEVIYKLRAILLSVRETGLVCANEEFAKWLQGDKTMPFGENNHLGAHSAGLILFNSEQFTIAEITLSNESNFPPRRRSSAPKIVVLTGFSNLSADTMIKTNL